MSQKPLIVITGASSGIGAATARAFAREGYPQLLLARRLDMVEALQLPQAICRRVDVLDRKAFAGALAEAEAAYGPVDCLVNNAGVMLNALIDRQDPAEWERVIDVNIKGVLNGVHLVLGGMIERKGGTIINLGSIAGHKMFPRHAAYCGTKFAVHGMTEGIREEVSQHNVRLINIAPGMTESELAQHSTDPEVRAGWLGYAQKIGGPLTSDTIADCILFAYRMPQSVCVREILVCPTKQEP